MPKGLKATLSKDMETLNPEKWYSQLLWCPLKNLNRANQEQSSRCGCQYISHKPFLTWKKMVEKGAGNQKKHKLFPINLDQLSDVAQLWCSNQNR